jgi:hypothetical protein
MSMAEEQSYEEMIQILNNFVKNTQENCNVMIQAAQDCVDNTEEDDSVVALNLTMKAKVNIIENNFETINEIIAALEQEIEKIRKANQEAKMDD